MAGLIGKLRRWLHILGWRSLIGAIIPPAVVLTYWVNVDAIPIVLSALLSAALITKGPRKVPSGTENAVTNAAGLIMALDQALLARSESRQTACILLELDDFHQLERELGNDSSDIVLDEVISRLHALLRPEDTLARISRYRFGIAVAAVRRPELGAVISLVERLQAGIADPIVTWHSSMHLSMSAGLCLDSGVLEHSGNGLVEGANDALHEAKRSSPGAIRAFAKKIRARAKPLTAPIEEVAKALQHGQIKPWFQPQISTSSGMITGFEALARWHNPEKGIMSPSEFLPVLESIEGTEELNKTILKQALKALKGWERAGYHVPSVAVNFATQELRNPALIERMKWDMGRFDLSPGRLTVEVLESVAADTDDDIIARNLRGLARDGFKIDLDDFGKGKASLLNIRRFDIDRIKIDRSFVMNVDHDCAQQKMIAAIISMAKQLDIETLAEGVSTLGEQGMLAELGCAHLQGFIVAKPMSFEDSLIWLSNHSGKLTKPSGKTISPARKAG